MKHTRLSFNKSSITFKILLLVLLLVVPLLVVTVLNINAARNQKQAAEASAAGVAVPTYQSIGLYWSPAGASPTNKATVQYRKQGETDWKDAQPLWYDTRTIGGKNPEYRGSIVTLQAGTTYEVKLTLASGPTVTLVTTTWTDPEKLPISKTITVPAGGPYTITEGGTPEGYVLYTANPGDTITASTVKADNQNAVTVNASYVIVRGLTVKGGMNGIFLTKDVHHVVVDRNDISAWGPDCPEGPGRCGPDPWSGVRARGTTNTDGVFHHITAQRNKIHDPNYHSNLWCEGFDGPGTTEHPHGVRGISFPPESYNNVIRYNEITGSLDRMFNDGMGNDNNFSTGGFPNADSDINGNIVMNVADDAIESEGGNENIRIWGNYIDQTFIGIGNASATVGPIYIFRNVMDRSDKCPRDTDGGYNATSVSKEFIKIDDSQASNSGGFRFVAHNTLLQRPGTSGAQNGFFVTQQQTGKLKNTFTRNNIFNVKSYPYNAATSNAFVNTDFDYDLAPRNNSNTVVGSHFLIGLPLYAGGNGDTNGSGGMYQLDQNSPGYDAGAVLANFSDGFIGAAPDIGAHEAGSSKMEFGINAYMPSNLTATVGVNQTGGAISIGESKTIDVVVNGNGKAFNAAQATVTVSPNLSVQSLTAPTTNACNFSYTETPTAANLSFAGAILASSSTQCTVYSVTVKAVSGGPGTITFSDSSVKAYADNSELLKEVINGNYTIAAPTSSLDTTPPNISSITVNPNPVAVGIKATTTVETTDVFGVTKVEFYSGSTLKATQTQPAGSVPVTTFSAKWEYSTAQTAIITVKSYDGAGNVTTSAPVTLTIGGTVTPTPTGTVSTPIPTQAPTSVPPTATQVPPTPTSILTIVKVPVIQTHPGPTYAGTTVLSGTKDALVTTIYVNGSSTGVTYPTATSWQTNVPLTLGANTFTVYGKDAANRQSNPASLSLTRSKLADVNGDGIVDLADVSLFSVDWGKTENFAYKTSDMNEDAVVDLTDFSILAKLYEENDPNPVPTIPPTGPTPTPTPIPTVTPAPPGASLLKPVNTYTSYKNLRYSNASTRLLLDLYLPDHNDIKPLIVYIHGGGWVTGNKDQCLTAGGTDFINRGFALACINYRYSSEDIYPAQIEDVKASIRWLRAHAAEYKLYSPKIAVWGSSAGGHLAALAGLTGDISAYDTGDNLQYSSKAQAVVDYFGPTDLVTMLNNPQDTNPQSYANGLQLVGGTGPTLSQRAQAASPITYVTSDDPPFYIAHGSSDSIVPSSQSTLLDQKLKQVNVTSQLSIIPGMGHGGAQLLEPARLDSVAGFVDTYIR